MVLSKTNASYQERNIPMAAKHNTLPEISDEWLLDFFEDHREKEHKDSTTHDVELKTIVTTQEQIYSYPDGTVYMGHMRTEEDAHGTTINIRHGSGTLRTPAFVYGIPHKNYTSDEAAENASFAKWNEYIGTWKNDKLHGYGVHVQKSGDGGEIRIFEGIWKNGKPFRSIHAKDEDGDYTFDETVFGW